MIVQGPGRQSGLKLRLLPETHTLDGMLSGSGVSYRFEVWSTAGSVVPGSFEALSGPVERLASCEVVFRQSNVIAGSLSDSRAVHGAGQRCR